MKSEDFDHTIFVFAPIVELMNTTKLCMASATVRLKERNMEPF